MSQKYTDARYPEKINDLIDNEGGLSEEGKKAIEESGVETKDPRIPEITPEDVGKIVSVDAEGNLILVEPTESLKIFKWSFRESKGGGWTWSGEWYTTSNELQGGVFLSGGQLSLSGPGGTTPPSGCIKGRIIARNGMSDGIAFWYLDAADNYTYKQSNMIWVSSLPSLKVEEVK